MVDTDVEVYDEADLERFRITPVASASSLRSRPLSASFLASSSSAIPFLYPVKLWTYHACRHLLAKELVGGITGQFGNQLRVGKLLCPGRSRDIRSFLSTGLALVTVMP